MKTHGKKGGSRTRWTRDETASLCVLYVQMLEADAAGELGPGKRYTKAGVLRGWIGAFAPGRSKGSVEAKLMNISGARRELGLDLLRGYVPLGNYARELEEIVLAVEKRLDEAIGLQVDRQVRARERAS